MWTLTYSFINMYVCTSYTLQQSVTDFLVLFPPFKTCTLHNSNLWQPTKLAYVNEIACKYTYKHLYIYLRLFTQKCYLHTFRSFLLHTEHPLSCSRYLLCCQRALERHFITTAAANAFSAVTAGLMLYLVSEMHKMLLHLTALHTLHSTPCVCWKYCNFVKKICFVYDFSWGWEVKDWLILFKKFLLLE